MTLQTLCRQRTHENLQCPTTGRGDRNPHPPFESNISKLQLAGQYKLVSLWKKVLSQPPFRQKRSVLSGGDHPSSPLQHGRSEDEQRESSVEQKWTTNRRLVCSRRSDGRSSRKKQTRRQLLTRLRCLRESRSQNSLQIAHAIIGCALKCWQSISSE